MSTTPNTRNKKSDGYYDVLASSLHRSLEKDLVLYVHMKAGRRHESKVGPLITSGGYRSLDHTLHGPSSRASFDRSLRRRSITAVTINDCSNGWSLGQRPITVFLRLVAVQGLARRICPPCRMTLRSAAPRRTFRSSPGKLIGGQNQKKKEGKNRLFRS